MNKLTAFWLLSLILLASSCNMKNYCSKRFPVKAESKDSISFVEITKYRDTLIFVPVYFESKKDTVFVDSSNSAYSTLTTSLAWSYAYFSNNKLIHYLQQNDSLIEINLKNAIKENSTISYRDKEIVKVEIKNELTGWQHTQIYAAWILAVILLINALWKKFLSNIFTKITHLLRKKKPP